MNRAISAGVIESLQDPVRMMAVVVLAILMAIPAGLAIPAHSEAGPGPRTAYTPWWDYAWKDRRPVAINNANNTDTLFGYQLMLNISYYNDMNADFSDLRFVFYNSSSSQNSEMPYYTESKVDGTYARIWVKVDMIQGAGIATIHMYYGNPAAVSKSDPDSVFDFFDDFNGADVNTSRWNVVSSAGFSVAGGELKGTSSTGCLRSKIYLYAGSIMESRVRGVTYAGNSHNPVSAFASTSDMIGHYWGYMTGGWTFYSFYVDAFPTTNYNWKNPETKAIFQIIMTKDSMTDLVKRDFDSFIFLDSWSLTHALLKKTIDGNEMIQIGRRADDSYQGQAYEAYWDWVRLRRYAPSDPVTTVGEAERPFKFVSLTFGPSRVSEGDTVFLNATFNNPTTDAMTLSFSAREADVFNASSEYFFTQEVNLAPSTDTSIPFTWTAAGGTRTIWAAAYEFPHGSVKIKVNRDPSIAPVKDQVLWQDRDFLLQLNASDPDGDTLSWSIDNPFFNISTVSNRSAEISVRPANGDVGVHRANITVRDPMDRNATRRINFTVNNINDPPELSKIPSLAATQYKQLRYKASALDPDIMWGDILSFSDNTDIFEIDPKTGEFAFTPVEEQVGKYNVKVTVTDIAGALATTAFTITVANVNDPPALEILPPQFVLQGKLFQLKIAANDPDLKSDPTEKLRFSDDSPLFNINNDSGLISFTPTNDQIGVWYSNITVTDKGGLANTTLLTTSVMNANDPPAMDAIPPQTATESVLFQYQCTASDPDLKWGMDNLTFSDDTELFNIDPKTGAIAFTPTGAQAGIKRVTITVKDDKGASASASFDITTVHVNHAPFDVAIRYPPDGAKLKEGDTMYLDGTAKDSDKGDTLEHSWFDNDAAVGTGRNISVKLSPGTHAIRLEVSDGTETVSSSISVQVEKKQTVTVTSSGSSMLPIAAAAVAVLAIVAVVAVLAMRRRKRYQEPEPSGMGRVESIPEGEGTALPSVPPPETGSKGSGDEARAVIRSTVDDLADYQEAHPEEALDFSPVMEKLDIAREMLGSGEDDDALDFARDAQAAANTIMAPKAQGAPSAPKKVVVKKKTVNR